MALPAFDSTNGIVAPDYAVPLEQVFRVETELAEDGTRWSELIDADAAISFSLAFRGLSPTEASAIKTFYEGRQGPLLSFAWQPPFLGMAKEAYGFDSPLSWSREGEDEYNLAVKVIRRPKESIA